MARPLPLATLKGIPLLTLLANVHAIPRGPWWIVSADTQRWKEEMLYLDQHNKNEGRLRGWAFSEDPRAKWWCAARADACARACVPLCMCTREVVVTGRVAAGRLETRDNKSFWLVATCESRKPGEAVYLEHLAQSISTWRYDAENPDDKMLWDLEPDTYYGDPTGKDLWYLVSNAASRNPNEMLYICLLYTSPSPRDS